MEKVTMYKSKSNRIFETSEECNTHELEEDIANSFVTIYGCTEGCKIYFDDFSLWAESNINWLAQFVNLKSRRND